MERRKVIRQGKGTLTMSLPMSWVRQLKLSSGDELEVEQRGFQLIVGPGTRQARKKTEVDLAGFSRGLIFVVLHNIYIRGDEEAKLHFDKPETYATVAEGIKQMIGFEIIEQSKNSCTIKELARGESEDFDAILRRVFLILLGMAEDGLNALKNRDTKELAMIMKRDESVNSLILYCLRTLNKKGNADIQRAMHLYALLVLLEQLGDCYSRFYRDVPKVSKQVINIGNDIATLLREFYELFYKFDKTKASELKDKRDKNRDKINNLLTTVECKNDLLALHYLRSIGDLIVDIEKFNIAMQL